MGPSLSRVEMLMEVCPPTRGWGAAATSGEGLGLEGAAGLERFLERIFDSVQPGGQFDRLVGVTTGKIQFLLVIFHFHLNKLQTVSGGDDHHSLAFVNL